MGAGSWPRDDALRLFRPRRVRGQLHRRHHRPMARGKLAVFDGAAAGPQVVIGSSMGGWLALLLARELARRQDGDPSIAWLVLIAPAVDFTEELMWKRFPPEVKREIERPACGRGRRNIPTSLIPLPVA